MCCSNTGYIKDQINGECLKCGEPTVDGEAYDKCDYSHTECDECGYSPCDDSCQAYTIQLHIFSQIKM